jgi:hypothetical protein
MIPEVGLAQELVATKQDGLEILTEYRGAVAFGGVVSQDNCAEVGGVQSMV